MLSRICPRTAARYRLFSSTATRISASTIFAPSTAPGKAAISIIRISGPNALSVWTHSTAPPRKQYKIARKGQSDSPHHPRRSYPPHPPPRRPILRTIIRPHTREVLDEGLVLYFPGKLFLSL